METEWVHLLEKFKTVAADFNDTLIISNGSNSPLSWNEINTVLEWDKKDLLDNARLSLNVQTIVISLYIIVILFGTGANLTILIAFCTNKVLLTTRNVLIANLAITDLILTTVSTPLYLVDITLKYWPLGVDMGWLCKAVGCIQCTAVFLSSSSIVLIALDRYRYILHPQATQMSISQVFLMTTASLLASLTLSSPLVVVTKLEVRKNLFSDIETSFCYEEWGDERLRLAYTITCSLLQYCIPCIFVVFAYTRVSVTVSSSSSQLPTEITSSATYKRKAARRRWTNILLTSVSLVFFLAWAPIHLFLVIMDTLEPLKEDEETALLIFACCHLTAMTTACVNPLLYGWCNNNFKGVITTTSTTSTTLKRINCTLGSVTKLNVKKCDGIINNM